MAPIICLVADPLVAEQAKEGISILTAEAVVAAVKAKQG
jgi:hypothetical protein